MQIEAIDIVRQFARNAAPEYVEAFTKGDALLDEYGINTPLRLAHFMAQVMHETGLRTLRENGRYTAENLARMWDKGNWHRYFRDRAHCISYAERTPIDGGVELFNLVYGNRRGNGPPESGDGWKYRGGGLLQTTGRGDYTRYGEFFDVDFVGDPNLIYAPEHALKPALKEWKESNLNVAADGNHVDVISRRINGSAKSLNERRAKFDRIWRYVRSQEEPEESREWQVQERLRAAGHDEVEADGIIGPVSIAAIIDYRVSHGLTPNGNIDGELLDTLGLEELAQIDRLPPTALATADAPPTPDRDKIAKLIELGSSKEGLARAREAASARLEGYPKNGCAAHLSALLNMAGIDVKATSGAGKLTERIKLRGWRKVEHEKQEPQPGDIGVTLDDDPSRLGP